MPPNRGGIMPHYAKGRLVCVEPSGITVSVFSIDGRDVFIPVERLDGCEITRDGDLLTATKMHKVGMEVLCREDLVQ